MGTKGLASGVVAVLLAIAPAHASVSSSVEIDAPSSPVGIVSMGPSVAAVSYGNMLLGGLQISTAFKVSEDMPVRLGLGFGLLYDPGYGAAYLPISITGRYEFSVPKSKATLYLGADVGMAYTVGAYEYGLTSTVFQAGLRPGMKVGYFFFEPRMGLVGDKLMLQTTLGAEFPL